MYYTEFEAGDANLVDYNNQTIGTRVTAGYPVNEINRLEYGVGFEHNKLSQLQAYAQICNWKFMPRIGIVKVGCIQQL